MFEYGFEACSPLWNGIVDGNFFEVSMLMFGISLSGNFYYIAHYILLGILSGAIGVIYFMDKNSGKGVKEGLRTGAVFLVTGIVLDAIITVPLFVKDYSFFFRLPLLLGYAEGLIVLGAIGFVKEKKGQ